MKIQSLSISVPEPCHEKWSEMSPVEKGRHCQVCQKNVVDFTRMHKAGIADYMIKNQGDTCGRFTSDQLGVNLIPAKRNKWFGKYTAILLGLLPSLGYAQVNHNVDKVEHRVIKGKRMMTCNNYEVNSKKDSVSNLGIISGKVLDEATGEPVLFGTVAVYDENEKLITGVETDLDGRFTISSEGADYIEASYIGFELTRLKIKEITSPITDVVITLKEGYLLGDIIVTGYVLEQKESWVKRVAKNFKNLIAEVFRSASGNQYCEEEYPLERNDEILGDDHHSENIKTSVLPKADLVLFPNPTNGIVEFDVPELSENSILQITNSQNQIILSMGISENSGIVDLSPYQAGTYIISIIIDDKLVHSKIIIKS